MDAVETLTQSLLMGRWKTEAAEAEATRATSKIHLQVMATRGSAGRRPGLSGRLGRLWCSLISIIIVFQKGFLSGPGGIRNIQSERVL